MSDKTFVTLDSNSIEDFLEDEMWCRRSAYIEFQYMHMLPVHFRFKPGEVPYTSFSYVSLIRHSTVSGYCDRTFARTYVKYFIEKG